METDGGSGLHHYSLCVCVCVFVCGGAIITRPPLSLMGLIGINNTVWKEHLCS